MSPSDLHHVVPVSRFSKLRGNHQQNSTCLGILNCFSIGPLYDGTMLPSLMILSISSPWLEPEFRSSLSNSLLIYVTNHIQMIFALCALSSPGPPRTRKLSVDCSEEEEAMDCRGRCIYVRHCRKGSREVTVAAVTRVFTFCSPWLRYTDEYADVSATLNPSTMQHWEQHQQSNNLHQFFTLTYYFQRKYIKFIYIVWDIESTLISALSVYGQQRYFKYWLLK